MLLRPGFYARATSTLGLLSRPRTTMPLRSKILNPAFSSQQKMSVSSSIPVIKEEPGDDPNDVLFNSNFGIRTIELNRPSKHNSLDGSMARKIVPRLQEWEKSQLANIIIIKGAGGRALCSGGDVLTLAQLNKQGPEGIRKSVNFFGLEYQLDHLIATYTKPYIAFMDGITMGGGVGLSVHAPFRIATEKTMFAMPETKIGFFPDVGASFFLPRLDGQIGTYLALTSEVLSGVQTLYAGIATHYIHSSSLPDLEARLSELTFDDDAAPREKWSIINSTIEEFVTGLPDEPIQLGGKVREAIDRCFSFNTVEDILDALGQEKNDWAETVQESILARSPTSLRVSLRLMRLGIGHEWTISEAFQREYSIAARFMEHPDFIEGVLALLLKPLRTPIWSPATLKETTDADAERLTTPSPGEPRLKLLRDFGDYLHYPHNGIGLPSEKEIRGVVEGRSIVKEDVVRFFVDSWNGKAGVAKKVWDVLERKTEASADGYVQWKAPNY